MVGFRKEDVDIPLPDDNFNLKATIFTPTTSIHENEWFIIFPGLLEHRKSYLTTFFSEKFAQAGYNILTYDYRAHGETAKQTGRNWLKMLPNIFSDSHEVINWLKKRQNIQNPQNDIIINLFGRSLGGAIILTRGFIEKRVSKLVALCTRYDYHSVSKIRFPEQTIKKISPLNFLKKDPQNNERILLAHCKDDEQIPFENILLIKDHLELSRENCLIFEKGGHSFRGHRDEIIKKTLKFLNE
jgi:esterase/lipase